MIDPRKTVAEIATENPRSTWVFERHGIDYCCNGERTLVGVCRERDIPVSRLVEEIEAASPPSLRMLAARRYDSLAELIHHIVSTHHTFARAELARLLPLAAKLKRDYVARYGELDRIAQLVAALAAELGPHMDEEERALFPTCVALETRRAGAVRVPSGGVASRISEMRREHETISEILRELKALTYGHAAPEGAPEGVRALYEALARLERDLHEHMHLENNVAFPAARELEQAMASAPT